ncbi:uncharacterized protein At4g22758-like [Salvia miltiorrhiza]|uniref:uncharacterized protein At4g22758-like n=1 Tax=Salvia miltiorrhiza TaxID=226208 RepID=UPI0025AC51D3|nr:uncharacterized protein At4g22758-like [Salvia miltiorrhiza]
MLYIHISCEFMIPKKRHFISCFKVFGKILKSLLQISMGSLSPPQRQNYGLERGAPPQRKNGSGGAADVKRRQLTKVLFNVSLQNSLWPVQVMMSPENTATELVKAAIGVYAEERRRPELRCTDPGRYELHYSQFSLESLKPEVKLMDLGSRNFYVSAKSGTAA